MKASASLLQEQRPLSLLRAQEQQVRLVRQLEQLQQHQPVQQQRAPPQRLEPLVQQLQAQQILHQLFSLLLSLQELSSLQSFSLQSFLPELLFQRRLLRLPSSQPLSLQEPSLLASLLQAAHRALSPLAPPYVEHGQLGRLPSKTRRCARQYPSTLISRAPLCS
jgi:hypothetical protein